MTELNAATRLRASEITLESLRQLGKEHKMNISKTGVWEAKNDSQDDSIAEFCDSLERVGFKRVKAKGGNEYAYDYVGHGLVVHYSARYGTGYSALLGIEKK